MGGEGSSDHNYIRKWGGQGGQETTIIISVDGRGGQGASSMQLVPVTWSITAKRQMASVLQSRSFYMHILNIQRNYPVFTYRLTQQFSNKWRVLSHSYPCSFTIVVACTSLYTLLHSTTANTKKSIVV